MTRSELCARVAARSSLSKAEVASALPALTSVVADALAEGETVTIAEFRKFAARRRSMPDSRILDPAKHQPCNADMEKVIAALLALGAPYSAPQAQEIVVVNTKVKFEEHLVNRRITYSGGNGDGVFHSDVRGDGVFHSDVRWKMVWKGRDMEGKWRWTNGRVCYSLPR